MTKKEPELLTTARHIPGLEEIMARPDVTELLEPLARRVPFKFHHSVRTGLTARDAHKSLGSSPEIQQLALIAGLKHDAFQVVKNTSEGLTIIERRVAAVTHSGIGTQEDRGILESHPTEAAHYIAEVQGLPDQAELIFHHHALQGTQASYPYRITQVPFTHERLKGYALFAAADTVDALLHMEERPYNPWQGDWRNETSPPSKWTVYEVGKELKDKFKSYLAPNELEAVLEAGERYVGKNVTNLAEAA